MTRAAVWLLRGIGAVATTGCVLVTTEAVIGGAWLAVPELAALELTVVASLCVAAMSTSERGRRLLALDAWPRARGWTGRMERVALVWCAALAVVLGVLPGLALELAPPYAWPPALVALAALAARTEARRRVVWLLCTSYGLAATASLVVVRHVL